MRKLPLPGHDPREVYRTCISRVRDGSLKQRLEAIEQDVVDAANAYITAASTGQLYTVVPNEKVGDVTNKEMSAVYTQRMVGTDGPGRPVYSQLIRAAKNGICPLCGLRPVSTLDHHLPKAHYPALAVVPVNLVPACSDCNKSKLDAVLTTSADQTIHPYFDDFETDTWLFAEVVEGKPAAVRYYAVPPTGWSDIDTQKVAKHFKSLQLATLYASHAAEELASIQYSLTMLLREAGVREVKEHLLREANSSAQVYLNSWKTALYTALSASDWYCNGGFLAV